MSSVETWTRPSSRAWAFPPSKSAWQARGPAPQVRYFLTKSGASSEPRRPHQLARIRRHRPRDEHLAYRPLRFEDRLAVEHCRDLRQLARCRRLSDGQLLLEAGVIDEDLEHEAVELGLGQRIGSLLLDRVLRAEHEERLLQGVVLAGGRDLVLLHGLEQGGLRLGGSAVDLVAEDDVTEDWSLDEAQPATARPLLFFEQLGAGDVGRHQIGRELDALEREREQVGNTGDHQCLGESGDTLKDAVALAEQGDQHLLEDLVLADDD